MRPVSRLPRVPVRRLLLPRAESQVLGAAMAILFGAWLIGTWAVGIAFVVIGLLLGADALLRDDGTGRRPATEHRGHKAIIEQYKRAP